MSKRRHEEVQSNASKSTMAIMAVAGLAVAALVVWALTRTVQPAPSVMTDVPMAVEQSPSATTSPVDPAQSPQSTPPSSATMAPPPADETAGVKRTEVAALRSQIDAKQVTVIDVRDKTSFINSHIPGSLHIPLAQIESQISFLNKNKPIVTYCTWPNEESSARAALILERYGFTNVSALKGGYEAWRNAGMPMGEGEPPAIP